MPTDGESLRVGGDKLSVEVIYWEAAKSWRWKADPVSPRWVFITQDEGRPLMTAHQAIAYAIEKVGILVRAISDQLHQIESTPIHLSEPQPAAPGSCLTKRDHWLEVQPKNPGRDYVDGDVFAESGSIKTRQGGIKLTLEKTTQPDGLIATGACGKCCFQAVNGKVVCLDHRAARDLGVAV